MELQHTDALAVIAEVSAAFVGFSLAIGLLQPNQADAHLRRHAMHSVAELGMVSAGGAVIVLVVHAFGFSEEVTWRLGSMFAASLLGTTFYLATKRYAADGYPLKSTDNVRYAAWLSVLGIVIFTANAAIPTGLAGPIHLAGLFVALFDCGYLFLLSTFFIGSDERAT